MEIQPKSFRAGVQTKAAVTESGIGGSFGGQLPPVQSLYAVGLGYEPTRVADLLPGAAMPGPSATWLTHTVNTNEAGIAAEGEPRSISVRPYGAPGHPDEDRRTVTTTLEAWQDTEKYGEGQLLPVAPAVELTRSLINEESSWPFWTRSRRAPTRSVGTTRTTFNGHPADVGNSDQDSRAVIALWTV